MKFPRMVFLASVAICAIVGRIMQADGPTLQANELEKLRGGNSNQMKCTATCNHLNGYDTPCANKRAGNICTICSGGSYTYSTQGTTPAPTGCTSNTTGFQSNANNDQQGCGFQIITATCVAQGTGLVCQGGSNTTTTCKGSVVVDAQSMPAPPPG
jgi:hypothetical protein